MSQEQVNEHIFFQDIVDAHERIKTYIPKPTPLLHDSILNRRLGFNLSVKAESLLPTGSFKYRGALNQLTLLTDRNGVFAMSAGNHAQAVAFVAADFGIRATILMPSDAPEVKIANTKFHGAEVITYDRATQDREAIGRQIAQERNLTIIHPYNDLRTIAGQGTIGLELQDQAADMIRRVDAIIVPCSGGGMAAGIAVATSEDYLNNYQFFKPPQIYTAEPEDFDDMSRSLEYKCPMTNNKQSSTICDALTAPTPGENPLKILQGYSAKGLSASDDFAAAGMYVASKYFGLVLEPGGAMALGCALKKHLFFRNENVVVIASGRNVDTDAYPALLERGKKALSQHLPELNL
jgi:threonine dehydratase